MKYKFNNLFKVQNGVACMPFSPGELARSISRHRGTSLVGLLRIHFIAESAFMFQQIEDGGYTSYDSLVVLLQYKDGIQAVFSLDQGTNIEMIASLFVGINQKEEYQRLYDGDCKSFQFENEEMKNLLKESINHKTA